MTTTTDIDALLSALTYDSWFTIVAIMADAYEEARDGKAEEACRDIMRHGRRPEIARECYLWSYHVNDGEGKMGRSMVEAIDKINGLLWTKEIRPQLTGFIAAWKEDYRP